METRAKQWQNNNEAHDNSNPSAEVQSSQLLNLFAQVCKVYEKCSKTLN